MLWDLSSEAAGRFFRSRNIPVKIAWRVPRCTHTYLVKHLLAVNHSSLGEQLLARYVKYSHKLRKSNFAQVNFLANIVARDIRSTTGQILHLIESESDMDPWTASEGSVREALKITLVPAQDMWRLPCSVSTS